MKNTSLTFVYTTDLHGDVTKYEAVYNFAIEHDVKLIHLGADLLPKKSGMAQEQKKFVRVYLKDFYNRCFAKGITVLAFFGNDDLYTRKSYFKKYASLLDETSYNDSGYEFKAYQYVQDCPFGLKTACKLDFPGWKLSEPYLSDPVEYTDKGWEVIKDVEKYFENKGTIEGDLHSINATNKTIMAIHQPPISLNLDVCIGGRRVGSKAVYDWIEKTQPKLVLCGHIHENHSVTGVWKANIGETVVIQPGQKIGSTTVVMITLNDEDVESYLIDIPDSCHI
jgi:Icc-related predicted phosphoesterase